MPAWILARRRRKSSSSFQLESFFSSIMGLAAATDREEPVNSNSISVCLRFFSVAKYHKKHAEQFWGTLYFITSLDREERSAP